MLTCNGQIRLIISYFDKNESIWCHFYVIDTISNDIVIGSDISIKWWTSVDFYTV